MARGNEIVLTCCVLLFFGMQLLHAQESQPRNIEKVVAEAVGDLYQGVPDVPPLPSAPSASAQPAKTVATPLATPVSSVGATMDSLRQGADALQMTAPRTHDVAYSVPAESSTNANAKNEPQIVIGRPVTRTNFGAEGNKIAAQLRSMPPEQFTFDRSSLRDVLRFLAEEAGIPYIGIPERSPVAMRLVTFRMTASPFAALESLARQNDINLSFEDGVWFMRLKDSNYERGLTVENENELIGVIYKLKHDPVDRVDFKNDSGGGAGGMGSGTSGGGGGGGGGSGGGSGLSSPNNLPLQAPQRVFETKAPRIVNEIRTMLGMKPLKYNDDGSIDDSEATSGEAGQKMIIPPLDGGIKEQAQAAQGGQQTAGAPLFPIYIPPQRPQVIYNSDTNILWVVATRKQHKWVADYLSRVDKPQDLIAIEVKFFETRKNPQTDFGINWEGTFGGDGLAVHGRATMNPTGDYQQNHTQTDTTLRNSGSQTGVDPGGLGPYNFANVANTANTLNTTINNLAIPYSAVLSTSEVSVALQAFARDRDSSLVQYPRVLTINNREVAITSAENTPVNAGTQNVSSGTTGGQNVGSLEYIPVGTQINILPKSVGGNQIALTVAITVSQIIDYVPLNLGTGENLYPVTSQRVYNAALQVDSGYTLAVGGLDKTADRKNVGGIPVLKDIPGLGYLFKTKGRSRERASLIIFITPYLIGDPAKTPGVSENPEAVIPLRPGVPPAVPEFDFEGALLGGPQAVASALAWVDFKLKFYRQVNAENRTSHESVRELRSVIAKARQLDTYLQLMAGDTSSGSPSMSAEAQQSKQLLIDLNKVLAASLGNIF